ncbi:MAG: DEAD/DEAH box helicase family protein [Opitutaceae bacterium]|nr:DEAD/DEAH box helicase family protein [Opitutaceae bacterium]MBP8962011.1 DEAD/DEAH box helicase family protein [Opitutaceae bacterium]
MPNHRPAGALPPARFALQLAGDLFPTPVQPSQKKRLSERDICTKFITPAITGGGKWDVMSQVSEEVSLTKGRVIVRGQLTTRGEAKRADYVLYHKPGIPLAVVEAKDNHHTVGAGMQQALGYAELLDVPFAFSSNGDAFLFHDATGQSAAVETEIALADFPSAEDLWERYCRWKGLTPPVRAIAEQDYLLQGPDKEPRYYQQIAINRTVEAVAAGRDRCLLVMATGTGKTFVAFQIIWRLWKARVKQRILFLADRNILVDQTRVNDFKPFGSKMTKIAGRKIDKAYEIYLALYQAVSGTEDIRNIYREFSPDFFDLIIVDECHRGSAADDSAWRDILEYFSSATQIGLTATPKETKDVSNSDYFGPPLFTYSLKQGIADGFLAPYKVVRIDLDKDIDGWRPAPGQLDKYGQLIDDRMYNRLDMDRTLVLDERTKLVAYRITQYLQATDPFAKTIVFCEDIEHAERMRQALILWNGPQVLANHKYVMRITGDDPVGKAELDNFILPESRYPVVVTTSRLLSTGVDVRTCKLIVLDQTIQSMTTFKQIIGRGTRVLPEYRKTWFTIMDFKGVTRLFADPAFDGEPVQIYEPKPDDEPEPPEPDGQDDDDILIDPPDSGRIKYHVAGEPVQIIRETVSYAAPDGRLVTESIRDFTRKQVRGEFPSLDRFLNEWTHAAKKTALLEVLERQGLPLAELQEAVGCDYDPFDLILHVAYDQPPLTRRERAERVRKRNYFAKYGPQARAVLEALLTQYADQGLAPVESPNALKVVPFASMGTPVELVRAFGGKDRYAAALHELTELLYAAS